LLLPLSLLVASLAGCGMFRKGAAGDDAPTIASLKDRRIEVQADTALETDEARTIAAYREFLAAAPQAPQRPEAMRRLGDLEMDGADKRLADGAQPDYKAAIARYEDFLKTYPSDPGNDRVLYQLARAHEQGGSLEVALNTLTQLVQQYPNTAYADEAQFRRGELLFATRQYAAAEAAYATVLKSANASPFNERALYMQGWSLFKLGRLDEALRPFFGVLDAKLGAADELNRGDRELVEDTFRVTSITLANLQGAASIAPLIDSSRRQVYEHQVYEQLGELYLRQERVKDAADTFGTFARLHPLHAKAPVLLSRVIDTYENNGFATLALDAKRDYVARYGVASEFRRANPAGWEQAQPLVKTHLAELARHHHALAQKTKASADVQEAVRWYRLWLASFPTDAQTPQNHFLLAELLFDDRQFVDAATEFEAVAYGYAPHPRSADAGYSALLSYAQQGGTTPEFQRAAIASALRFADTFGNDARAGAVLTNSAEQLFSLHDSEAAASAARRALAKTLTAAERRTAWTVIAHTAFEAQAWSDAEKAYGEALALTADNAAGRNDLVERLAASVYQQGDAARSAGRQREAVAFFERVASVAPASAVRATAQFDAAAALIGLQDWAGATRLLEDFRARFPAHPLQADVDGKLAAAYLAQERWSLAAGELERVAAKAEPEVARAALWQAAELHDKAAAANGPKTAAVQAYARYLSRYPQPLEAAVLARWRLAQMSSGPAVLVWMKDIVQADASGGAARTERTKALAASATLALAEPVAAGYRQVQLVEPLQKQLKLKKTKMEEALKAYAAAAEYGVAEVSTAATFQTAALYQDFGKALMASQRPKKLSKLELEQYNVMLEEQAFPFEEKAIQLHETNAQRAAAGLYDDSVRASFAALAQLKPGRWGKVERADPASPLNQQGIALRGKGSFDQAREAYEAAINADPKIATPVLNLAILHDLYLGDRTKALALYERYLQLATPPDAAVAKWVAELKGRKQAAAPAQAPVQATAAANVASRKETP
jgi:tetratricopeptide (TPR) repeat protein